MNTTETFWSVDGVSLQTYAFNITTLGDDRDGVPPLRGSDIEIPYMPGTMWVPREVDSRYITLGMWVVGANEDGTIPTGETSRRIYERNWRKLRRLLWTPRRQFTLTKKFWVLTEELEEAGVDLSESLSDGLWTLYEASARGTFAGGLSPNMTGGTRATFTVDILLSDPFFYGAPIEIPFSTQTGEGFPGPTQSIVVLGDDRTLNIEIDLEGPLTGPQITHDAGYVRYGTEVPDDESATLEIKHFRATQFTSGEPFRASGYVKHSGNKFWFFLDPGEVTVELSAQAGTGVGTLKYQPAWW